MPEELVPGLEADRVGAQQPCHASHQVGLGGCNHQMEVIGHEAISVNLKTSLLARFCQSLEEILPIHIIEEDLVPSVTTAHYVVNGTGILNSEFARHGGRFPKQQRTVKQNMNESMG
jgi:hypothetical protein